MATITRFEDSKKYSFKDQIERASTSVMNNIAEGFECGSDKDFTKFLYISKASAGEVRSMLYLAEDRKFINQKTAIKLRESYFKLSFSINNFIKYLNK